VVTPAPPPLPAAPPLSEGIVFSFSASCWVDIRDSSRKFKLFGEMAKGTSRVLGGVPPYKVVLGNASAVSVTVNGEPFDLDPFARGNVARFTLDP
jgi:cytoskeleton protein RodZ